MTTEEVSQDQEIVSPAAEVVSAELPEGTPESPGLSTESHEVDDSQAALEALQAKIESADTPEERQAHKTELNEWYAQNRREKRALKEAELVALKEAAYQRGLAEGRKTEPAKELPKEAAPYVAPDFLKPMPKESDFEDYSDFQAAKDDYLVEKAEFRAYHKAKAEIAAEQTQREQESQAVQYSKWKQQGTELYPDFLEVAKPDEIPLTMAMREAIRNSEHGHSIAYHLGKNPQEYNRIINLPNPFQQATEIGKIAERITATPPKPTTKAPPPITPVKGGVAVAHKALEDMDTAEYIATRDREEFGRSG